MTSMLVGCAMTSISCTIFIPDQIFSFLLSSPTTSRTSPVPLMSAVLMHADVACRGGAPQAARRGQPAGPGCAARAGLCVWPAGAGGGGGGGRVLRAGAAGSGLRADAEEEEEEEEEPEEDKSGETNFSLQFLNFGPSASCKTPSSPGL